MPDPIEIAKRAAADAGAVVRAHATSAGAVRTKSTAIDLVTETDIAAGVAAVRAVLELDPQAAFLVEEAEVYDLTGVRRGDPASERTWVIDPIDGTTSFLHGYPCFSVSVGLFDDGRAIAGAVYNVASDEMNWAAEGGGAYRDGVRLRVTAEPSIERAVLVTGFPYDRTRPLELQLAALSAFLRLPVQDIRRDGSAAVDCCHVAAGRCDGFWEYELRLWDMAAGALIAREAGATVTDVNGNTWGPASTSICAANPELHAKMVALIEAATTGI